MDKKEAGLITTITIFCLYLIFHYVYSFAIFFIIIFGLILFSFSRMIQLRKYDGNLINERKIEIESPESTSKFCFNCRSSYNSDIVFCQLCGIRL